VNRNLSIGVGALAAVLLVLVLSALFTVHQTQQALVLQFGDPKRVVTEPGLHFKLPFVQNAVYIDRRVLDFDAEAAEVILGDQKRLVVDAFARYRIVDPLRFYQSVGDEVRLRGRFDTILDASLRKVLGEVPLFTVLSADRHALMNRIRDLANTEAKQFGIDVVDVRIKRADLPAENSQAIYRRMQTERDREAKELRAQGAELAQRIRARADRERRVIIAEAQKEGEITRGQGDAEAVRIFADAVGRDVDFFTFYRSMQAYRDALADDNTSFVLSPDSEFFRFFNSPTLAPVEQAHNPAAGHAAAADRAPLQPATDDAALAPPADGAATSKRPPGTASSVQ
jgi:modulator of FtsH protease HflC